MTHGFDTKAVADKIQTFGFSELSKQKLNPNLFEKNLNPCPF